MQLFDSLFGGREVAPVHAVLASKGRLVNLGMGRCGRDSAEIDGLHAKGVGRAEHAAHVVKAPHVVENDDERQLPGFLERLDGKPVHLDGLEFAHHDWAEYTSA